MSGRPQYVTSDSEEILDDAVHREEALRVSQGLKPSHLALSLARGLMDLADRPVKKRRSCSG